VNINDTTARSDTTDIAAWMRDNAQPGPLGVHMERAADEIARLRSLLWEIMSAPESAYHGDWFARATEALPPCEEQDG